MKRTSKGRWLPGSGPMKCAACGNEFQDRRARARRTPFCSPPCAKAALLDAQANREAIVELRDDGVWCVLCKKLFEVAGTHFARIHGLETSGALTKSERQAAYGLPQGSRLASLAILENMSRNAIASGFSELGCAHAEAAKGKKKPERRPIISERSAAQRLQSERLGVLGLDWSQQEHEESLVDWTCATCGKQERRQRSKARRRYCSLACRPTEQHVERLKEAGERRHRESIARRTKECEWCHRSWVPSFKHSDARTCSRQCQGALKASEHRRHACAIAGCEHEAVGRRLCTKHYQQKRADRRSQEARICVHCSQPFFGRHASRKFCSRACADAAIRPRGSCTVSGCGGTHLARGLCGKHYAEARRKITKT